MRRYFQAKYAFHGDRSSNQLSFPAGALIIVPDNPNALTADWIWGQFLTDFGWFPAQYASPVQVLEVETNVESRDSEHGVIPRQKPRQAQPQPQPQPQPQQQQHQQQQQQQQQRLPWVKDEQREPASDGFFGAPMGGFAPEPSISVSAPPGARRALDDLPQDGMITIVAPPRKKTLLEKAQKSFIKVGTGTVNIVNATGQRMKNRKRVSDESCTKPSLTITP